MIRVSPVNVSLGLVTVLSLVQPGARLADQNRSWEFSVGMNDLAGIDRLDALAAVLKLCWKDSSHASK